MTQPPSESRGAYPVMYERLVHDPRSSSDPAAVVDFPDLVPGVPHELWRDYDLSASLAADDLLNPDEMPGFAATIAGIMVSAPGGVEHSLDGNRAGRSRGHRTPSEAITDSLVRLNAGINPGVSLVGYNNAHNACRSTIEGTLTQAIKRSPLYIRGRSSGEDRVYVDFGQRDERGDVVWADVPLREWAYTLADTAVDMFATPAFKTRMADWRSAQRDGFADLGYSRNGRLEFSDAVAAAKLLMDSQHRPTGQDPPRLFRAEDDPRTGSGAQN